MKEIKLTIKGKPIPNNTKYWVNPATKKVISYKPPKVKRYKELIQMAVTEHCLTHKSFKPFETPVTMTLNIFRSIPKSYSKKLKAELLGGPAAKKPDIDNQVKVILDSISKDAWNKGHHLIKNDSLVCDLHITKRYAEEDYIEITLSSMEKI